MAHNFYFGRSTGPGNGGDVEDDDEKKSESWEIKLSLFRQMGFFIIFAICCTFGKKVSAKKVLFPALNTIFLSQKISAAETNYFILSDKYLGSLKVACTAE